MPAGAFSPAWDALGPVLNSLQLEGNPLQGQLPASWGQSWTNVSDFTFTGSQLQGTLPREWGLNGSFPNLFNIIMVGNANLTGEAPPIAFESGSGGDECSLKCGSRAHLQGHSAADETQESEGCCELAAHPQALHASVWCCMDRLDQ